MKIKKMLKVISVLIIFFSIILLVGRATNYAANSALIESKPPLSGLVTMGNVNDLRHGKFDVLKEANVHPDVYSGVVIHTTWGALEPERGVYDFSSIDTALKKIEQYNKAHPANPIRSKIRISKTINPPDWVLHLGNGPVYIVLDTGQKIPIGLYWTPEYRKAWQELQKNLAARYDNNNLIAEICVNSGAMITDEPFVAIFNKPTIANLHMKGYTDKAFKETLEGALDDYACWLKTPIIFSFNMLREIDSGIPVINEGFTLSLMKEFRARYGERAVLSNCGLKEHLNKAAVPIYEMFKELGPPISVQTIGPKDLNKESLEVGLEYGVTEFEIWSSKEAGGYAEFTQEDLISWNNLIESKINNKPNLDVDIPTKTDKKEITVRGTTAPNITVVINGKTLYSDNAGEFATTIPLNEGNNAIIIVAIGRIGGKTTKTITVTYEKPVQTITITLQPDNPYMTVNGVSQEIDPGRGTKPVIIPKWGRTVVPIRAIVEALGGTIGWNGKERKVTINFNDTVIELWIDNPKAKVNGETKWIDPNNHNVKPIIVNDRTMLPLRFVAENLGCKVDWDAATRTITITFDG